MIIINSVRCFILQLRKGLKELITLQLMSESSVGVGVLREGEF